MKSNFEKGYELPEKLVSVMNLASELNAAVCDMAVGERERLVSDGWFSRESVGMMTDDLRKACDHADSVMQSLADYGSMLLKTEMTEKGK